MRLFSFFLIWLGGSLGVGALCAALETGTPIAMLAGFVWGITAVLAYTATE